MLIWFGFLLLVLTLAMVFTRGFLFILNLGAISLIVMLIYLLLGAPDVAMTEAALGVGLTTILVVNYYISLLNRSGNNVNNQNAIASSSSEQEDITIQAGIEEQEQQEEKKESDTSHFWQHLKDYKYFYFYMGFCGVIAVVLVNLIDWSSLYLQKSVIHDYYIFNTYKDIHINSFIAGILACYRGFDTLIETCVIFIGGIGVFYVANIHNWYENTRDRRYEILYENRYDKNRNNQYADAFMDKKLQQDVGNVNLNKYFNKKQKNNENCGIDTENNENYMNAIYYENGQRSKIGVIKNSVQAYENNVDDKPNTLITVIFRVLLIYMVIFALYVQLNGTISPGGGFQFGGIVASIAILMMKFFKNYKVNPILLLRIGAIGVFLYFAVGASSLFFGLDFLDYIYLHSSSYVARHIGIELVELGVGIAVSSMLFLIYLVSERFNV